MPPGSCSRSSCCSSCCACSRSCRWRYRQVVVPDIGGHSDVDVIAVEVKVGDTVAVDDTLITLETDKATMDVPCTEAGVVKAVFLKVGDKVSEGSAIIE